MKLYSILRTDFIHDKRIPEPQILRQVAAESDEAFFRVLKTVEEKWNRGHKLKLQTYLKRISRRIAFANGQDIKPIMSDILKFWVEIGHIKVKNI